MQEILKLFSPSMLLGLLPIICIKIGNYFKNKDDNATGVDDAAGNLLIALAPALDALDNGNESAFKKALRIVRDTIDSYLKTSPV